MPELPTYLAGAASQPKVQKIKTQKVEQAPAPVQPDPVEEPDTLHSNSYARVVDAICEGPIDGLCDKNGRVILPGEGLGRAIFLDETPLLNEDKKANFQGVKIGMTFGEQDQDVIAGFGKAEETIYVSQRVKHGLPVSVGIQNPDADFVEVAVRIPSLMFQEKKTGDLRGATVTYEVWVSLNSGTYTRLKTEVVKGKASSAYIRTTSHRLPHSSNPNADSWTLQVRRVTADAATVNLVNDTYLDYVTVRTRNKFRYPNTVLVAGEIDAKGFSGIPQRAYRVRGLRIKIPSNYFPETRTYNRKQDGTANTVNVTVPNPNPRPGGPKRITVTVDNPTPGALPAVAEIQVQNTNQSTLTVPFPVEVTWDGTFYVAWSNNPAWCFYDLATNSRYGLGDYMPPERVDKWSLYTIARYCDDLVDDGFDGLEPRYTTNLYIQGREEAWKVLTDMASVFRGMLYWTGGSVVAVQDRPKDALALFTNANVAQGQFQYSGTAKKARTTVAMVRWNDPADFYRPKFEHVQDDEGVLRYGVREVDVAAFGCTSRGQAHRLGRWMLFTNLNETETVAFQAGLDGSYLRPGDIIDVMDNDRAGKMHAGRLLSVAGDRLSVRLDRGVRIPAGTVKIKLARPKANLAPNQVANVGQIPQIRAEQLVELTITNASSPATVSGQALTRVQVAKGSPVVTGEALVNWSTVLAGDFVAIGGKSYRIAGVQPGPWRLILEHPYPGESSPSEPYEIQTTRITFATAIPAEVEAAFVWMIETPDLVPQQFRVLRVEEQEGMRYNVQCLEFNVSKFGKVEANLELEEPDITDLPAFLNEPLEPQNVTVTRGAVVTPEGARPTITVAWEHPPDPLVDRFRVEWRRDGGNWELLEETTTHISTLGYTIPGLYEFTITSLNTIGTRSDQVLVAIEIPEGNPIEIVAIEGLELQGQGNDTNFIGLDAKFQWRLSNPNTVIEPGQESPSGEEGYTDPYFETFEVTVWDVALGVRVFRELTRNPWWIFTYAKNTESTGGPRAQFEVQVRAFDKFGNSSAPAKLVVQNPAPSAPTDVRIEAAWRVVHLEWRQPPDYDLDYVQIWRSVTPSIVDADMVATVAGNTYTASNQEAGRQYWFWLRSVDTFGTRSVAYPVDGLTVTMGTIGASEIQDFEIDASKIWMNAVVLQSDRWEDNQPIAGSIRWNSHRLFFRGRAYEIAGAETALQYVWWKGPTYAPDGTEVTPGETAYRLSQDHPKDAGMMGNNDFIIATNANNAGTHNTAWRGFANAVIGSAFIKNAAIKNAHIESLAADKITAGLIDSEVIRVGGVAGGIQSVDYAPGETGWRIAGDGSAELNNLLVRENLALGAGYFNPAYPARVFNAAPRALIPFSVARTYWRSSSHPEQTLQAPDYGFADVVKRGRIWYPGFYEGRGWPLKTAAIFAGLDCDDFDYDPSDGDIGAHPLDIMAKPFRLAQDGWNLFTFLLTARAHTHLSVWYQTGPRPHGQGADTTNSLGNKWPGQNEGRDWNFAAYMKEETSLGMATFTLSARVNIFVPKNHWILFGIAPVKYDGAVVAVSGGGYYSTMTNGYFEVVAENLKVGYPSAEVPNPEEP